MNLRDFTRFDKMITPTIIKILFCIGVAFSIIMGIIQIFSGLFGGEGGLVFFGLITIIFGPLGARIYCELLIVIFKINQNLSELNGKIAKKDL